MLAASLTSTLVACAFDNHDLGLTTSANSHAQTPAHAGTQEFVAIDMALICGIPYMPMSAGSGWHITGYELLGPGSVNRLARLRDL